MKVFECDDGNTRNGDGCSSDCKIEPFYECKGGNETNADMCIWRKAPTFKNMKYYGNRTGILSFSTSVQLSEKLEDLLEISIDGSDSGSEVEWEYSLSNPRKFDKIRFQFSYKYSLIGTEDLIIKVLKPNKIMDMNENMLQQTMVKTQVAKYKYISEADKEGAEGTGAVSLYAMLPSLAISVGLSLILYFSISAIIEIAILLLKVCGLQ